MDDDEFEARIEALAEDIQVLADTLARVEQQFITLSDDFTKLRAEVNALERKIDRRT